MTETPKIVEAAKEKASEAISVAKENVTGAVTKGVDMVREQTAKYGFMILVALVVGVLLLLLAYVLYVYLSSKLTNKITVLIPESKMPRKGTELSKLNGTMIPSGGNGNRMTYSFWIYIYDINKFAADKELRHVLHFGEETLTGASPAVYLDGKTNKMYVRFDRRSDTQTAVPTTFSSRLAAIMASQSTDPEKVSAGFSANSTVSSFDDAVKIDMAKRGIIIDYIPLQRWVHVAVVVNESVNRGYMSAYLDGELVKTVSSNEKEKLSDGTKHIVYNFQNLNIGKAGNIYIGGDIYNENVQRGFSGMVSKIVVSNYDLNGLEIKKIYTQGPIDNLTSKLGLPAYGVRSPVYRLG